MPLTATIEDIKAYQEKVEKDKITSKDLPPCPRCNLDSLLFKIHAYRERRFLVIVEMLIKSVHCTLIRFRCTGCNKTITNYPDFAIPHKHYTRQTIFNFSNSYIEDDQKTYKTAVISDDGVPENSDSGHLAPSTIHRWVSTLAYLNIAYQAILATSLQKNPSSNCLKNLAHLAIPERKFKTHKRKRCLLRCRWFFQVESFLESQFSPSLQ